MLYFNAAKYLWKTYVPKRGQAETVQGELIRAVEKLRDEAHRNGNINWDEGHEALAGYLLEHLTSSGAFDARMCMRIKADLDRIMDFERPYTEDDLYDRLIDRVVEWWMCNPEPIPHEYNDALWR